MEEERDSRQEQWELEEGRRFDEEQEELKKGMSPEEWKIFNAQQHDEWMEQGSCHFEMVTNKIDMVERKRKEEFDHFVKLHPEFASA